jgi:hypothetical protein
MPARKSKTKPKAASKHHPILKRTRRSLQKSPPPSTGQVLVDGALAGTGFRQRRDPADDAFPLSAVTPAVDDPRSQERVWLLPAHLLNQGSTNSCVGHACAHFILAAPIMEHSTDPIALWHRAQQIDEFPNNEGTNTGTSVRAGFKVLQEQNLITTDYRWAANADEALRFVLKRGPLVVGTKWYPGMSEARDGVLRLTGNPGNTGHAYLLFGFSPDADSFLVANSWGRSWATDGMAFLPYGAFELLLEQGGVACSAIES